MTMMFLSLIFAASLFIHFEICMRTRPNGWVAHAVAAENFLLKIGPPCVPGVPQTSLDACQFY